MANQPLDPPPLDDASEPPLAAYAELLGLPGPAGHAGPAGSAGLAAPPNHASTSHQPTPLPPNASVLPPRVSSGSQQPQPPKRKYRYTQDVDFVRVSTVSGVQSIENRFGPKARRRIYANLQGLFVEDDQGFYFHASADGSDDGDDDFDDDDDMSSTDDWGDINTTATGAATGQGNENSDDAGDAADEDDGSNSENDDMPVDDPSAPSQPTFTTAQFGTSLAELLATAHGGSPNGSDGTAAQNPNAQSSGTSGSSIPRVARARVNLTALSQQYNLYFAVYQDEIHVFRPQPAPEILRGPLLVLRPPATAAGRQLGGHMSHANPHQANHMIIGDLGGVEVMVLAYDDGDVVGYYVRHIVNYVARATKRPRRKQPAPKVPQPFLLETVGMTAWGLAVHSQSRLIAVSSNLAEVNVFAFALHPPNVDGSSDYGRPLLDVPEEDLSPTTYSGFTALQLESLLRLRDRPWRILLPLGPSGHNIPCIDFISDTNGVAEKVAAIDINGSIFILDIWKVGSRPLKIPSLGRNGDLGWGVSIIPIEMFLPTTKMPSPADVRMLDREHPPNCEGSLFFAHQNDPSVKEPMAMPAAYDMATGDDAESDLESDTGMSDIDGERGEGGENDNNSEDMDDSDVDGDDYSDDSRSDGPVYMRRQNGATDSTSYANEPATMSRHWDVLLRRNFQYSLPKGFDIRMVTQTVFRMGMIICPSIGLTWPDQDLPTLLGTLKNARYRLDHSHEENLHQSRTISPEAKHMSQRFFLLRAYSTSVEIVNTDRTVPPFYMQNVIKPPKCEPAMWDMRRDFHRCSLLHMIPEINLIIVANMFGRVVLLRPLRNSRPRSTPGAPLWAYRVEWILPLVRDERNENRPSCCLLGTAVSPLPEPGSRRFGMTSTKKNFCADAPRRYRLILHYVDHTILQYYIDGSKPGKDRLDVRTM